MNIEDIVLSSDAFDWLLERLQDPPQGIPEMRRLFADVMQPAIYHALRTHDATRTRFGVSLEAARDAADALLAGPPFPTRSSSEGESPRPSPAVVAAEPDPE